MGLVVVAMVAVVAVAGAIIAWLEGSDGGAPRSSGLPAVPVGFDPAARTAGVVGGLAVEVVDVSTPGPGLPSTIALSIMTDDAESGTSGQVQVSFEPDFGGASWEPIGDGTVTIDTLNAGYQELFVRFDVDPSATVVLGVEVDPTAAAATASAEGAHMPSWVRTAGTNQLIVRVETGRIERGALEPYDLNAPASGDVIEDRNGLSTVVRNGEPYGFAVSARSDVIRRVDRRIGRPLDVDAVLDAGWSVVDESGRVVDVAEVDVVSRPAGGGYDANGERIWTTTHDFLLTLSEPLPWGRQLTVAPAAPSAGDSSSDLIAPAVFELDPAVTPSVLLHTSQVGFAPSDASKIGYVGSWIGGSLPVAEGSQFTVVSLGSSTSPTGENSDPSPTGENADTDTTGENAETGRPGVYGEVVLEGSLTTAGSPSTDQVLIADFGSLTAPGRYRFCVDGLGCSLPFTVGDAVWSDMAATVARATFYQRSGIAIDAPFSSFTRPRPYHPDDGVIVSGSTVSEGEVATLPGNGFEEIVAGATDEVVPEAWGGHFDAGDWDRRIYHLALARTASELVRRYPEQFAQWELDIPESGDAVPDILDEALWSLDLYRRMQGDDGSIRGAIEAAEHPPAQATSWVDDLAVFALAPDSWSSYVYAGAAAEVAETLTPYAPDRAATYLDSAVAAFGWAESAPVAEGLEEATDDQRLVALVALYRATGDDGYHRLFLDRVGERGLGDPATGSDLLSCHQHGLCDALWLYAEADPTTTDAGLRQLFVDRFVSSADAVIDFADANGYRWTAENPGVPLIWGLGAGGTPRGITLSRAFALTGDQRYRDAMVDAASVSLGANPLNRSLVTGRGIDPPRNPQITDVKQGGLPQWPGVPVYGFHRLNSLGDDQWVLDWVLSPGGVRPTEPDRLPYLWQWFDVDMVAFFSEYTVHQSLSDSLLTYGTLAATS